MKILRRLLGIICYVVLLPITCIQFLCYCIWWLITGKMLTEEHDPVSHIVYEFINPYEETNHIEANLLARLKSLLSNTKE